MCMWDTHEKKNTDDQEFLSRGRLYSNLGEGWRHFSSDAWSWRFRVLQSPSVAGRKGCWAWLDSPPLCRTVCGMRATAVSSWHRSWGSWVFINSVGQKSADTGWSSSKPQNSQLSSWGKRGRWTPWVQEESLRIPSIRDSLFLG